MHAERSGPAGEAMLRATSRPRPDVMLGYWAPVLAPPRTAANAIAEAIANLRSQHTPYTLVLGEEPDSATRTWMAQHFPEATVIALPDSGHFPTSPIPTRSPESSRPSNADRETPSGLLEQTFQAQAWTATSRPTSAPVLGGE